jgi:uncharacterized protein (DUF924 family)
MGGICSTNERNSFKFWSENHNVKYNKKDTCVDENINLRFREAGCKRCGGLE